MHSFINACYFIKSPKFEETIGLLGINNDILLLFCFKRIHIYIYFFFSDARFRFPQISKKEID